ncbi:MAG: radical SAM protein [Bacilli bacterium]|nr:radical SAM protein [Bacilli bacterium]
MHRIGIENFGCMVTNKCNLNCAHCMRGCKNNKSMQQDVIEAFFKQVAFVGNLCLCGGEITLATETIKKIFDYIEKKNILLGQVTTVINGTNYSEEFLQLLDEINQYIKTSFDNSEESCATFTISYDEYHKSEIERLHLWKQYLENVQRYQQSIHFAGMQGLDSTLKLFREGNAQSLDTSLTVLLKPFNWYSTYMGQNHSFDEQNGVLYVGPLVTVNVDGIITECDASIEHMGNKYNYGSILTESLEEIIERKSKVLRPHKCFEKWSKEQKRYQNYNK